MNPTIEINLKNIKKNWLYLDGLSKKNIETGAVIKANAYGLGSNEVANALWEVGNRSFFVATAEEGIVLNKNLPIYFYGSIPLLFTWGIMGLWHGSSGRFFIWGLLNGFFIIIHRIVKEIDFRFLKNITFYINFFFISNI